MSEPMNWEKIKERCIVFGERMYGFGACREMTKNIKYAKKEEEDFLAFIRRLIEKTAVPRKFIGGHRD